MIDRERAEAIVSKALGTEGIPDASLRRLLREKLGREPRHRDLFALLAAIRKEVGYGSISIEMLGQILRPEDLVRYILRLRGPE